MPRCNDCNKFASLDTDVEPEVQEDTLNEDSGCLSFDVSVRITNNCSDCGAELREAVLDVSDTFDTEPEEGMEYTIEVDELSRIDRSEGKGRSVKTFYGFEATVVLSGDGEELERKSIGDDIQASHMDEL